MFSRPLRTLTLGTQTLNPQVLPLSTQYPYFWASIHWDQPRQPSIYLLHSPYHITRFWFTGPRVLIFRCWGKGECAGTMRWFMGQVSALGVSIQHLVHIITYSVFIHEKYKLHYTWWLMMKACGVFKVKYAQVVLFRGIYSHANTCRSTNGPTEVH